MSMQIIILIFWSHDLSLITPKVTNNWVNLIYLEIRENRICMNRDDDVNLWKER